MVLYGIRTRSTYRLNENHVYTAREHRLKYHVQTAGSYTLQTQPMLWVSDVECPVSSGSADTRLHMPPTVPVSEHLTPTPSHAHPEAEPLL